MQYGPVVYRLAFVLASIRRCLLQYETHTFMAVTNCENKRCLYKDACTALYEVASSYVNNGVLARDYAKKMGSKQKMGRAKFAFWQCMHGKVLNGPFEPT